MKQPRVLFINRPERYWKGGDTVKMNAVSAELRKLGVHVDIFELEHLGMDEWYGVEDYDIIHTWNFSMLWSKYAVWLAGKKKKKAVASMIYYNTEAFVPFDLQQVMMDHMDACIYETENEIERVKKNLTPRNSFIVGNGIDEWWFEPTDMKVPFKKYVLTVGRIEPNKGQLEAAIACKELGITYVCIGDTAIEDYSKKVLAEGAILYPSMPKEKLKAWYKHCSAYVQPSLSETWGMAADEAASQGAKVIVSTGFERQNLLSAIYCQHASVGSIKSSIEYALKQKKSAKWKNQLRKRTWKHVAEDYLKIYEQIT